MAVYGVFIWLDVKRSEGHGWYDLPGTALGLVSEETNVRFKRWLQHAIRTHPAFAL